MEDLIYILIGLAWFIYSAYKANQKKVARQSAGLRTDSSVVEPTDSTPNEPKTLMTDDILERFFSGDQGISFDSNKTDSYSWSDDSGTLPPKADEIKVKPIVDSIKVQYESVEYNSRHASDTAKPADTKAKFAVQSDESEIFSFDLRQAVIHQAVLNRPYF